MKISVVLLASLALITSLAAQESMAQETTPQEFMVEERGGVQLWSIPQASPTDGLQSTILELRTVDPEGEIASFTNYNLRAEANGKIHQVWLDGPFGGPTPQITSIERLLSAGGYASDWALRDSHLLIGLETLGGFHGSGFDGITESNDRSSPFDDDLSISPSSLGAVAGYGDITVDDPTRALMVLRREFLSNRVRFAQVVGCGDIRVTVGVFGNRFIDAGRSGGAEFGYDDAAPVASPFDACVVPEPGFSVLYALIVVCAVVLRRRSCRDVLTRRQR